MKTKRLLAATVFATVTTVLALGGGAVQAHMDSGSAAAILTHVLPAPRDNHAPTDVTAALSDLVDVDRALKAASLEERMSARAAFSRLAQSQVHGSAGATGNRR